MFATTSKVFLSIIASCVFSITLSSSGFNGLNFRLLRLYGSGLKIIVLPIYSCLLSISLTIAGLHFVFE